jgi:predicted Zn finger-like uncharacterized protein
MLIVCPSCASTYSLTPEQLGAGRRLRCAACRHEWFATPPQDEAGDAPLFPALSHDADPMVSPQAATSSGSPATEPARSRGRRGRKTPSGPKVSLGNRLKGATARLRRVTPLHIGVAALALALVAGIVQRTPIVRAVPQTAKLYAALGLAVNLRGLEFHGVRSSLVKDGDQSILVVEGEIRAVAKGPVDLPRLQLGLRGADGHEIYAWTAEAPRAALQPGETTPFRARLVAPPSEGLDVVVRFVERDARVARQETGPSGTRQ